jgi:amidase
VTDAQFVQASQFRERFRQHLAALLGDDGVLVLPTMPDIAPLRSADEASLEAYRNNAVQMLCIAGLSGFPQISLPLAGRGGAAGHLAAGTEG